MAVGISPHGCTCLCSWRSVGVGVCVCLRGNSSAADQKGKSSCLVIGARATLVGSRHACTSACNGSERKVPTVTKETWPMGGIEWAPSARCRATLDGDEAGVDHVLVTSGSVCVGSIYNKGCERIPAVTTLNQRWGQGVLLKGPQAHKHTSWHSYTCEDFHRHNAFIQLVTQTQF